MPLADSPITEFPSSEDQSLARKSSKTIAEFGGSFPQISLVGDGIDCPVPPGAVQQFAKILSLMAAGQPVEVVPGLPELTVQQAARFLDFTEGHINELLDDNVLEHRQDGDLRFIKRDSLLQFEQEHRRSSVILARLTQEAQEMGLYDD